MFNDDSRVYLVAVCCLKRILSDTEHSLNSPSSFEIWRCSQEQLFWRKKQFVSSIVIQRRDGFVVVTAVRDQNLGCSCFSFFFCFFQAEVFGIDLCKKEKEKGKKKKFVFREKWWRSDL
jgi:hypothetical protein